jgi:hypothetical protein
LESPNGRLRGNESGDSWLIANPAVIFWKTLLSAAEFSQIYEIQPLPKEFLALFKKSAGRDSF